MAIDSLGAVHLIHVDLRRGPYMPGGQKVDFDRRTAMYQICIKTADTNPYQRVPPRPTINRFALLSGMI
jgi:hypothetical protein